MRVAVIGSMGMAGHIIADYLQSCGADVERIARSGYFDILDKKSVDSTLDRLDGYHYVVNCTGLLVADSNRMPDVAATVNGWFPHYLARRFSGGNTRVIHLSTDCVFDGSTGNYREDDRPTETNYYGRSKSYGEINNSKDITLRTSIIGPELKRDGTGLMNWFCNLSGGKVDGWVDSWWSGLTTLQMAKCIRAWMENPSVTGIVHLVNNNLNINKYDLLCLINDVYGLDKSIMPVNGPKKINKILVDTRGKFDWRIPDYHTQLVQLRDWSEGKLGLGE